MAFVKIHVLEGRYDEARLGRVSNAIQQALRTELGTAPDELLHIIHLLQPAQFRHTRSFLGLNYSDDLIWLELTLIAGCVTKEKRLGLLKALNHAVVDAAQISPDDLLVTFFETAGENISFGRGLAQRADNQKPYPRRPRGFASRRTVACLGGHRDASKRSSKFFSTTRLFR